ncbi:hypothetical protein HDU96_002865, partial [Phlyctochytrium bullatum]
MSTLLSPPSEAYSQTQLITNVLRALTMGYGISVVTLCSILASLDNRSVAGTAAILPLASGLFMVVANLGSIIVDVLRPGCAGRAVLVYIVTYCGQICLEIYQTNRIRVLAHHHPISRTVAYALFILRASSLCTLLFFFQDSQNSTNRICITVYPPTALIVEKVIVLVYNAGNLGVLLHLARMGSKGGLSGGAEGGALVRGGTVKGRGTGTVKGRAGGTGTPARVASMNSAMGPASP